MHQSSPLEVMVVHVQEWEITIHVVQYCATHAREGFHLLSASMILLKHFLLLHRYACPILSCCDQGSAHFLYCRKTQLFRHAWLLTRPAQNQQELTSAPIITCTAIVYLKPSIRECTWRDLFDDDTLISKTIDLINLWPCIQPIEYISNFTVCIYVQGLQWFPRILSKSFPWNPGGRC
jgi:hypothetical protein